MHYIKKFNLGGFTRIMDYNEILYYDILNRIDLKIEIQKSIHNIPANMLFEMAARKNPKRSFLFVSKILGKHIPVNPRIALLGGAALGAIYAEEICKQKTPYLEEIISSIKNEKNPLEIYDKIIDKPFKLKEPTLFIGFAETATALGHSVFSSFSKSGYFIHTTRENIIENRSLITFEEEHSHATSHRIYPRNFSVLQSQSPIVLVDDEITTGKTALNIIAAIHKLFPRKSYTVLSLLDWRSDSDKEEFKIVERNLGVEINTFSLISGTIDVNGKVLDAVTSNKKLDMPSNEDISIKYIYLDDFFKQRVVYPSETYLEHTGRFGICSEEDKELDEQIENAGQYLRKHRRQGRILCVGTGEFMYIPMKIASFMGEDVLFQSTTRSPIYPKNISKYGIKNAFDFQNPENDEIINYLYNIPYKYYDELYLFFEKDVNEEKMKPLICKLKRLGIENINIVIC